MKATIESTNAIVTMKDHDGRPYKARVWRGVSEAGVEFTLYVAATQVLRTENCSEFERDLPESPAPGASTQRAIDLRFII
jgi:hypothetical protein